LSSPYINRFLSADTIVSNPVNPQSLNRFSYVLNNPLRYSDPTGHSVCEDYAGTCLSENQVTQLWNNTQNNKNHHHDDDHDGSDDDPLSSADLDSDPPPVDGYYCQASALACWANFTQDMATTVDGLLAGLEVVLVGGGCMSGGFAGCGAGLLTSWEIFNMGPNQLESGLSGVSLLLTAIDDYSEDIQLGENTATSFTTFVIGGMSPDPIADVIIDGYASGYNHEFFNGVFTLANSGPFLQNPAIYK
jgi:hypothetical protein